MSRRWMAVPLIWLPLGVAVATWTAWSDRLPDEMATHWNGTGPADDYSSTTAFFTVLMVVGVLAAVTGTVAAALVGRFATTAEQPGSAAFAGRAAMAHFLIPAAGSATGGIVGIWVTTALATLDNPADARLGWGFLFFLVGLAWGVVVRAVAGPAPRLKPGATPAPADTLGLKPTERAAFRTSLGSPLLTGVTLGVAAIIAVLAATIQPALWLVLALPVLAGLLFGRITVTADHRGLRLAAGLIGVPVKHIPLADITTATAEDINPIEWGGWGYRVTPGRSALVLRGGPGLVIYRRDGRRFAVTLDDPQVPADLLTALRARVPN